MRRRSSMLDRVLCVRRGWSGYICFTGHGCARVDRLCITCWDRQLNLDHKTGYALTSPCYTSGHSGHQDTRCNGVVAILLLYMGGTSAGSGRMQIWHVVINTIDLVLVSVARTSLPLRVERIRSILRCGQLIAHWPYTAPLAPLVHHTRQLTIKAQIRIVTNKAPHLILVLTAALASFAFIIRDQDRLPRFGEPSARIVPSPAKVEAALAGHLRG